MEERRMKKIEVYTSDTCGQCVKLKEILKEKGLVYTEHNISSNLEAKRELIRMGYMSIPVMVIEGEYVLGLDMSRIEFLLSK